MNTTIIDLFGNVTSFVATSQDLCLINDVVSSCHNGGKCIQDIISYCRCVDPWEGDLCLEKTVAPLRPNSFSMIPTMYFALFCSAILLLFSLILICIVFVRYRLRKNQQEDYLMTATAEQIYRRPFNKRSSIVESLSRSNSVKRTNAANKENHFEEIDV